MDFTLRQIKKWYPYMFFLLTAIFFELVIGNFSSFKTHFCTPIPLIQEEAETVGGIYETSYTVVNQDVKNIYIELELFDAEQAEVTIFLTDEGDKYAYGLPTFAVVPGEVSTQYTNLYAFGDVKEMQVTVTVPEWAGAKLTAIELNKPQPMKFHVIRMLVLFLLISFFYAIRKESCLHTIYCERKNKYQYLAILLLTIAVIAAGAFLVRSNPMCVRSPWLHQRQYQELAVSLSKGSVELPLKPTEELIQAENPYDTIALLVDEITYNMDYAYFEGKYYVYFGIIPEVLFFLPYFLATGQDLSNYLVVFMLYSGFCIGVFGLLWELVQRYGKNVPFIHYLLLAVGVCGTSNFIYLVARPDLYNIPIMAANCFTVWGIGLWLKGLNTTRWRGVWYFLGSLCMAMVAGCRPQLLLYSLTGVALFYHAVVKERTLFSKKSWKETLCFCLPYFLVGALVFWYNLARFGSGFDFGATYSLTSNDMNHRGFNLARVFHGLYSFLMQPPVLKSSFPFIFSSQLESGYMGKNMTEFTFGGIFATNFLLLVIVYWIFINRKKLTRESGAFVWILSISSFIIAVFDVNGAGILQRYMSDMVLGLLLTAVIMWIYLLSRKEENTGYFIVSRIFSIVIISGLVFSFLMVFAKGDSVNLQNNNPALFYRIASYFKF